MPEFLMPEYTREFFVLQLAFARKMAELKPQPLASVLLKHTNLYIRLGLGRDFNPEDPDWLAFLQGFSEAADPLEWTWRAYLASLSKPSGPPLAARFGCFGYGLSDPDGIRLHFQHQPHEQTSLGASVRIQRHRELALLFRHLEAEHPERTRVAGVSWLYNLEAYRQLFPEAYVSSLQQLAPRFHSMTLWGQFLNRRGELNQALVRDFYARLNRLEQIEKAGACFPFQVLAAEAPVQVFTDFFAQA